MRHEDTVSCNSVLYKISSLITFFTNCVYVVQQSAIVSAMIMHTLIAFLVALIGLSDVLASFCVPICISGEVVVPYCDALGVKEECYFCQPDSNIGLRCDKNSDCHDAHGVCDGGRCTCADCGKCSCNLPYVNSRGPYYGGDCTRGSNLGSICVSDDGCVDGELCDGKRCGCSKRVKGPPRCECNSNTGFYDTNGDVFGGQCVDGDQRCMCHPDCYDNEGQCDGQRCECIKGFCHFPDRSP